MVIAITYSIIAPLVLGFATVSFGIIYIAARYNSLYILTNNVDTKGAAYAKVLQQMMTGVYLSEVCLIGLFAINTAPGPIVLMAVFLGATAIYHVAMHHALKPLVDYLPDSYDGDGQANMFVTTDHKSYDLSKSGGVPPSQVQTTSPKTLTAKKASLFGRVWDPKKFRSHQTVLSLVPNHPEPSYLQGEKENAYYNPVIKNPVPQLWIVRDEMGISRQEVKDSSEVVHITDEYATFNEKNKVVWTQAENDGHLNLSEVPVWEKRVDY